MKAKKYLGILVAASALTIPSVPLYAATSDHSGSKETMGEKIDDATITSKVKMELMANKGTSALHTDVDTTNGVVTLTGKAKTVSEKKLATEVAKKVKGVKRVINDIAVVPVQ
ncbi:BON domain-containing protein [Geotalea sp. SG265]|uniref:BON domain-containing protein n=1 Tax=Geotalea sp. SG265 TaxID=2922867 RepID=UPI001FAFD41F|nr:BON domain-containing protein [Geotalea sp. SG265]